MTAPRTSAPIGAEVMGILNVTPDSFSDGGLFEDPADARDQAASMLARGAAVVDVGGESTRPGASPVDPLTEQARILPVLEAVSETCADAGVRCSVDTRHADTARAAVAAGATIINDVSASLHEVAAELGVGWVAVHMSGDPRTMQEAPSYDDVVDEVRSFLARRAERARLVGVGEVWVDPGIGFGKSTAHNVALLANIGSLVDDGTPVLLGVSRKRSLGVLLARSDFGHDPHPGPPGGRAYFDGQDPVGTEDRLDGSLVMATWAALQGVRMIRAHDVGATVRAMEIAAGADSAGDREE